MANATDQFSAFLAHRQGAENVTRQGLSFQVIPVKMMLGAPAVDGGDLSLTNPMPVAQTDRVVVNGVLLEVKSTWVTVAASQTDSSVVAAVASKSIRVVSFFALAGGTATTLQFNTKGAGAGVAISPVLANDANGGEVTPLMPSGWVKTTAGEGLTVTTGAGSSTSLIVFYVEV